MNTKNLAGTPWRGVVKRAQRRRARARKTPLGSARDWAESDRFYRILRKVREAVCRTRRAQRTATTFLKFARPIYVPVRQEFTCEPTASWVDLADYRITNA